MGLRPQNRGYGCKLGNGAPSLRGSLGDALFCQRRVDLNISHLNTFEYKDKK